MKRLVGAGCVALALLGCSDSTPADPPPRHFDVRFDVSGDTLGGRGLGVLVAVRDTTQRLREVTVAVNDGAGLTVDRVTADYTYSFGDYRGWSGVVYFPGPGRYTVTVTAADQRGRAETTTSARLVRAADEPYAVTALPDRGADAGAHWVDARGAVAGWVGTPNGGRRPAVWRGGALAEVPVTDSVDAEAVRVNTAGDVLLQLQPYKAVDSYRAVRVRAADGRELVLGPLTTRLGDGRAVAACCTVAADLTESRRAVGAPSSPLLGAPPSSVVLDVATGRADSVAGAYRLMNARGQAVHVTETGSLYSSSFVVPVGFTMPALPGESVRRRCDIPGRYTRTTPIDLDDAGNLLVDFCGTPAYLPASGAAGASRWLDRAFGGPLVGVRLARQGGLVAAVDSAGALWLWRAASGRTTRARLADASWRLDALGTVNASGAVAAHGVHAATGRRAALLLTPAR